MNQEYLKSLLRYDGSTGQFIWIKPPKQHPRMLNKTAGADNTGYILIKIDGKKYKAHRLAWLYVYGTLPVSNLDHINGNPFDNRINNLRECTQAQNIANMRRWANKMLPKGVKRAGKKFQARITYQKKVLHLGIYETVDEASDAYFNKSVELYGEFARRD